MWTEYALTAQQFKSRKSLLSKGAHLEEAAGKTLTSLSVLDSIDGRLLAAGYCAFWIPLSGRSGVLCVRDKKSHIRKVELPLKAQPKTPADLPPHLLGGDLHAALGARAFIALVQQPASIEISRLSVKNHVVADITAIQLKGSKQHSLWVDGRRGYEAAPRQAFDALSKAKAGSSLIEEMTRKAEKAAALNAKGFPPLKPAQSTASALRTLHETLLAQMNSQVSGTAEDVDIEFLHDLRVSSRRARSLLQTMRGHLVDEKQAYAIDTNRWIGQQTTDLRDLDVYLADFPALEKAVSAELAGALEPFKAALKSQRVRALRQVRALLKSARFKTYQSGWASALKDKEAFHKSAHSVPIFETASAAILKRYTRICKDGSKITSDTPAEALHDLRKEGKKLRYLLEFFASLYPSELVKPRIASLKKLQDLLGAYQDCAVQAEFLETKAVALRQDTKVPAETLMAMGALADQRLQDEKRLRLDFEAFFKPFSNKEEQKKYQAMTRASK